MSLSSTPLLPVSPTPPNYLPDKAVAGTVAVVSFSTSLYTALTSEPTNWVTVVATTVTCIFAMTLLGRLFYHDAQFVMDLDEVTIQTPDEPAFDLQPVADKVSKIKRSLNLKTQSKDLAGDLDLIHDSIASILEKIHDIQQMATFNEEPEELDTSLLELEHIATYLKQLQAYAAEDQELIDSLNKTLADSDQQIEELQKAIGEMKDSQTTSPDGWNKVQSLLTQLTTHSSSSRSMASLPATPSTPGDRHRQRFIGTPKKLNFDNQ